MPDTMPAMGLQWCWNEVTMIYIVLNIVELRSYTNFVWPLLLDSEKLTTNSNSN